MEPSEASLVGDVMRRWPATMRAFLDHRMHCIGCPIACFHTVKDACHEHGVDSRVFMAELQKAILAGREPPLSGASGAQAAGQPEQI